jgi:hypothetical protein
MPSSTVRLWRTKPRSRSALVADDRGTADAHRPGDSCWLRVVSSARKDAASLRRRNHSRGREQSEKSDRRGRVARCSRSGRLHVDVSDRKFPSWLPTSRALLRRLVSPSRSDRCRRVRASRAAPGGRASLRRPAAKPIPPTAEPPPPAINLSGFSASLSARLLGRMRIGLGRRAQGRVARFAGRWQLPDGLAGRSRPLPEEVTRTCGRDAR